MRTRNGTTKACLVDVYDTILRSAFHERAAVLADMAGVPAELWIPAEVALSQERDTGAVTPAEEFAATLAACGRDPDPALVASLMAANVDLLCSRTQVCEDTVPFFEAARERGIALALVSNCGFSTRTMLAAKGLLDLADVVILSCEVGIAKPDPGIYLFALQQLGVLSADAVFLDDRPDYCGGAESVGIRPIQVARPDLDGAQPDPRFESVPTLLDALPLL